MKFFHLKRDGKTVLISRTWNKKEKVYGHFWNMSPNLYFARRTLIKDRVLFS
jgi:hypothetical protein